VHTTRYIMRTNNCVVKIWHRQAAELEIPRHLRQRQVRVRILTNSLESTPDLIAQSAYQPCCAPFSRRRPGTIRGASASGQRTYG
jgi:hypothetical protein